MAFNSHSHASEKKGTVLTSGATHLYVHPIQDYENALERVGEQAHLHHVSGEEDYETFMDVFALTIYEVLLFPNLENFMDYSAIAVFIAFKIRSQSLVMTILADTNITLDLCHVRKKKLMVCYLPTLSGFLSRIKSRWN